MMHNYQRKTPAFDLSEISGEPRVDIWDLITGVSFIALAIITAYILFWVEPVMNNL